MKPSAVARRKRPKGRRFVAIDFETANHSRDSACSVGIAIAEGGRLVALERRLIRPPTSEFFFTYIHGLTWNEVRDEPSFAEVWRDLDPVIAGADFLAAHNASFDRSVLHACCATHRLRLPNSRSSALYRSYPSPHLTIK